MAGSENGGMLENDDPYGTFAMFSRSRWLRNGPEMLPEAYFSDARVQTSAEGVSGSVVGASRELQDGSGDGRMAKPQTTVGPPWVHRGPKSAGKAVQAGRVLHSKSRQTRLPGGGGLPPPAAIHHRPLEACVRGLL